MQQLSVRVTKQYVLEMFPAPDATENFILNVSGCRGVEPVLVQLHRWCAANGFDFTEYEDDIQIIAQICPYCSLPLSGHDGWKEGHTYDGRRLLARAANPYPLSFIGPANLLFPKLPTSTLVMGTGARANPDTAHSTDDFRWPCDNHLPPFMNDAARETCEVCTRPRPKT
jgi:hypothetical protein